MNVVTGTVNAEPIPQTPTRFSAFVGYVRVSSKRQASEGGGLDEQRAELEAYSLEYGAELFGPFEDTLSGYKPTSSKRPGLRTAIEEAVRRQTPLLVARVDRLTRSHDDLVLLERDDLLIVATDRGLVERAVLKAAVAKAQVQSDTKKRNAQNQHARRRSGSGCAVPSAFSPGRKIGAQSNKIRADRRVEELADHLRANPDLMPLSPKELAAHLNAIGPLNLKSVHGLREPWTTEALRPVRKAALAVVAGQGATMSTLDSVGPSGSSQATGAAIPPGTETGIKAMSMEEITRIVLPMDCSTARPLTEHERTLLAKIIEADFSGEKTLKKKTIDTAMNILRARGAVRSEADLLNIQRFFQCRAGQPQHVPGSPMQGSDSAGGVDEWQGAAGSPTELAAP